MVICSVYYRSGKFWSSKQARRQATDTYSVDQLNVGDLRGINFDKWLMELDFEGYFPHCELKVQVLLTDQTKSLPSKVTTDLKSLTDLIVTT